MTVLLIRNINVETKVETNNLIKMQKILNIDEKEQYQAFENALQSLKECGKDEVRIINNAKMILFESANKIIKTDIGKGIFENYHHQLQERSKKEIRVIIDENIDAAAGFEFAENHDRSFHLIKYKPNFAVAYPLMMHELVHLEFVLEAREKSCNKLFIANEASRKLFIASSRNHRLKLKTLGYPENSIETYYSSLFSKISSLIFNTPIDLFIEDKLFNEFPDLRPLQFLSLFAIVSGGVKESTEKTLFIHTPQLFSHSFRVLNIVLAMEFRDLYGINLISEFNPSYIENSIANKFYEEFKEYRNDREPGEEYELVENWAKDLNLDKYSRFIDEIEYRKQKTE